MDVAAYAATQLNSKINDVQKQIGAKKKVPAPVHYPYQSPEPRLTK
jgi:hypothetical protein